MKYLPLMVIYQENLTTPKSNQQQSINFPFRSPFAQKYMAKKF